MTNQQQNADLPPKTCSIDRLVTVKEDVQKVLEGKKTAARRNGKPSITRREAIRISVCSTTGSARMRQQDWKFGRWPMPIWPRCAAPASTRSICTCGISLHSTISTRSMQPRFRKRRASPILIQRYRRAANGRPWTSS